MGGKIDQRNLITSVMLPRAMRDWLAQEAERVNVSRSGVVRGAISLFRSQPEAVRRAVAEEAQREETGLPDPRA